LAQIEIYVACTLKFT